MEHSATTHTRSLRPNDLSSQVAQTSCGNMFLALSLPTDLNQRVLAKTDGSLLALGGLSVGSDMCKHVSRICNPQRKGRRNDTQKCGTCDGHHVAPHRILRPLPSSRIPSIFSLRLHLCPVHFFLVTSSFSPSQAALTVVSLRLGPRQLTDNRIVGALSLAKRAASAGCSWHLRKMVCLSDSDILQTTTPTLSTRWRSRCGDNLW